MTQQLVNEIVAPDISHIVIEDDTPVDNFQSAKQQRLLVEPLYASWSPGVSFIADSNIGLFYALKQDPIVPDNFLSLGVEIPPDWSLKQNRSYFVWEFGKVPEVCIEIVSNREGGELDRKLRDYAHIGVACYAVFDPLKQLQKADELNGALLKVWMLNGKKYVELPEPFWLEPVELGLTLWEGEFEGVQDVWLRWCDSTGQVIPTGKEAAAQAKTEAAQAKTELEQLREKLKAQGIDPDSL